MGASETKGFSATKRKKYTFKCISKGCKNQEKINKSFLKGNIRYSDKYSTKNMYCTACKRRIQRFKFTASDDSDTESIPVASKSPDGQLLLDKLLYLSPEKDISTQTATAPQATVDKPTSDTEDGAKDLITPSAPPLSSDPSSLYPNVSDFEKEVKFQQYLDDPEVQKAKGARRKDSSSQEAGDAQLPKMRDSRLEAFLDDSDDGNESDDDDSDSDEDNKPKRPLTPLQEAMANTMNGLEDEINFIDDQIELTKVLINALPDGEEKNKEIRKLRRLISQKMRANKTQRKQSSQIAKLESAHQLERAKYGEKISRHNDALRHVGRKKITDQKAKYGAEHLSGKCPDSESKPLISFSDDEKSPDATTRKGGKEAKKEAKGRDKQDPKGDPRKSNEGQRRHRVAPDRSPSSSPSSSSSSSSSSSEDESSHDSDAHNGNRPESGELPRNHGRTQNPGRPPNEGNHERNSSSRANVGDRDRPPNSRASDSTNATSVFALSRIGSLIEDLKESLENATSVVKNHPSSKTMTDEAKMKVVACLKNAKSKIPKIKSSREWGQTTPAERDQVDDLIKDLKDIERQLVANLSKIHDDEERRRLQPKSTLPVWYGDAATYFDFAEKIEQAVKFKDEGQKITDLASCIKGNEAKDLVKLFRHEKTFKDAIAKLNLFFENLETLVPGEEAKIRKLKDFPASPSDENNNILKIIEYYNLLKARDRVDLFSVSFYHECMSKLSHFNAKYYGKKSHKHIKRRSKFIEHLERILEENSKSLGAKGLSRFASKPSDKPPPPKSDKGGKGRTGVLKTGTEPEDSGRRRTPKCAVCDADHQTYQCPTLRAADTDPCKRILAKKKICEKCLRNKNGENHKGKCDWLYRRNRCPEPCTKGLNKSICCERPDLTPQDRDAPSSSTMTAGASERHVTILNSVPIGASASLVETIQCNVKGIGPIKIGLMYDKGSQSTLISSSLRPFVKGYQKGVFWIDTVSGSKRIEAGTGHITVDSIKGPVNVFGIVKELSRPFANSHRIKVPHLWQTLYKVPSEYSINNFLYQIVLGNDAHELHPVDIITHNGLTLSESKITGKPLISGYNKDALNSRTEMGQGTNNSTSVMLIRSSAYKPLGDEMAHPIFKTALNHIDSQLIARLTPDQDFVSKRLCAECREREHCVKCRLDLNCISKAQSQETKILSDAISYSAESKRYKYSGVYRDNVASVPSYLEETKLRMEKLVKKLRKDPNGAAIAAEMDKSIQANIADGVFAWGQEWIAEDPTRADLQSCYSPVSYALKREGTTKVRLVHDYSFSHGGKISFNDTQLLGSSGNFKIGHILLLHRAFEHYSVADIKKFYYCVSVADETAALQQFIWKPGGILSDEPWQAVVPLRMIFGRRDAQSVCQSAKLKCAEQFLHDKPEALNWVRKSYTDDVCCASNKGPEAMENIQRQIEDALKNGNMVFKPWVNSGAAKEGENEKIMSPSNLAASHLGIKWLSATDEWAVSFVLNLEPRKRGIKPPEMDLTTHEQISEYVKTNGLTKRQALAITHILWDPLSLYMSQTVNAKILYRNLITAQPSLQWKDEIAKSALPDWEKHLHQIIDIKDVKVPRCGLPEGWREGLTLCLSTDGSQSCSVGRAFLRSDKPNETGSHPVSYICGVSKLGETGVSAAIKSETNALLLTCRLAEQIATTFENEPEIKFSEILIVTDSKALLSIVQMDPSRMKLWFISRVGEINHIMNALKIKLLFTRSENCDADETSKLNLDENVTLNPTYWTSKFFFKPKSQWPVELISELDPELNENVTAQVGNTRLKVMNAQIKKDKLITDLLAKYNDFDKVSKALAYIKCFLNKKDFATNKFEAQNLLLDLAQPTESQIEVLKKQFVVTHSDPDLPGAVLVSREFTTDNRTTSFKYRVVNGNTQIGRALINSLHRHVMSPDREHALALERGFYIIGGRQLFRKLTKTCVTCRKIRSFTVHPPAGQSLLLEAMKGDRYQTVTIDVFGYLRAKVGRSTVKVYFLTTSCHKTLHVTFSVMLDNSAASLMSAFQRTMHNVAAVCRVCVSDSGTNIVTIKDLGLNGNDEQIEIKDVAAAMQAAGVTFRTSTSSPWRSTRAEKAHHLLKVALRRSGLAKHHHYSIEEWFHIASHMSRILNDRPLTLSTIGDQLTTITPNKLIYGNAIGHLNVDFSPRAKLYDRLLRLEKDLAAWQNVFLNTYVKDQLNYLEKIQGTDAALQPGSVVLIKDHLNPVTKFPALGTITSVQSDRTYLVDYVKREPETKFEAGRLIVKRPALLGELQRPAQRLVFLFHPDENAETHSEIILDPILGQPNDTQDTMDLPTAKRTQPSMKFIADDDAVSTIMDIQKTQKIKNKKQKIQK